MVLFVIFISSKQNLLHSATATYISTFSKIKMPEKGSLIKLYKDFDPKILKSGDENAIKEHFASKIPIIVDYVKKYYDEDLNKICNGQEDWIILSGLIVANGELNETVSADASGNTPTWVHCALAAVTGYEGFDKLFSGTAGLMTAKAGLEIVKNFLKRYLGYFGIAIAIYEFGECMGWY